MKKKIFLGIIIFIAILSTNAFAEPLTKKDIIDLTKQGYTHEQILQKIAETHSRFTLTTEEEEWLRSEGVNYWVIRFMKLSKKQEKKAEFLERGDIQRGGVPISGGKYYDNAVAISPDRYRLNHQLRASEYDYFKIDLQNGQRLTCSVRTTDASYHAGIAIHSAERTRISEAYVDVAQMKNSCFYEVFDSPDTKSVYILIGTHYPTNEHVIYDIEVEDHFDVGSNTDAGNYYDTALKIKPGNYENNWASYADVDMYALDLKRGRKLEVKVMPDKTQRSHRITVLNEDRETLASHTSKERGSVAKVSLVNEGSSSKIYIKVDHAGDDFQPEGKYTLKLDVK